MNNEPHTINERTCTNIMSEPKQQASSPGRPVDWQKDSAILNAAREMLFTEGPQAVTMESVAKRAGVSKVTVYSRHANRNELIAAAMGHQADIFSAAFVPVEGDKQDIRHALLTFGRELMHFLVSPEHLRYLRALSAAHATDLNIDTLYRQGPQNIAQNLSDWLAIQVGNGTILCEHPLRSAEMFLGMLMRMDLVRALYGFKFDYSEQELNEHVDFVVNMFLHMHQSTI